MGAILEVCWSKSFFYIFTSFSTKKRKTVKKAMCKKEENMQQVWYKEQLKNIKPNSGLYSNQAVMYA